jgi:hypothetical protein
MLRRERNHAPRTSRCDRSFAPRRPQGRHQLNRSSFRRVRVVAAGLVSAGLIVSLGGASIASARVGPPGGVRSPGGVFKAYPGPKAPSFWALTASPQNVTLGWKDQSTDEQKFVVMKRTQQGGWVAIYDVPTRNMASTGDDYSYVDTGMLESGQCYMIVAVNDRGTGYSKERCTVRPDPTQFPQSVPHGFLKQWSGLSRRNDGTGQLRNTMPDSGYLIHAHQTFGVDLNWSHDPALWKIEAQGGPNLMYGQAVALRVWGGGWLKYEHETYGVNLVLSGTPSYEWHVVGETPGHPLDFHQFALWNSAANDYLVKAHETWGASLAWYQDTLPPSTTPPPPAGVKTFVATNCITGERPLEMWVQDVSAGTGWADMGRLDSQYADGGCPDTGQPFTFTPPQSGHTYAVRALDYSAEGCSNDPTIGSCSKSDTTFVSDTNGQVLNDPIG